MAFEAMYCEPVLPSLPNELQDRDYWKDFKDLYETK